MNISNGQVARLISTFFERAKVTQVAYQTNFEQRSGGKLSGLLFLQAWVFACLEHSQVSLNKVAQSCLDLGVAITPQGLAQRLSAASVAFLEQMFRQALSCFFNQVALPLPLLSQFRAINLIDSSSIPLADELATTYPGSGGNAPAAILKLRLVFDFLSHNIRQLILAPGRQSDKNFSGYLSVVQAGSLNLMDLGFFNLTVLAQIDQRQAYFLSRYQSGTCLFTSEGTALELLRDLSHQSSPITQMTVLVGKQQRLKCRLIAFRLPQEVADQRRYRAKQAAQRRGKTVSPTTLALLDWSIYLTNVPETMLSAEQVALLYRVRWQIELLFKLCKSYCGLRSFARLGLHRLLTELYARLIGLVLLCFLTAPLRLLSVNQELSLVQARLICQRFARRLNQALGQPELVAETLLDFHQHLLHFGFKPKRKAKPNICHALALASTVFQLQFSLEQEVDLLALPPFSLHNLC
jgi:hypothetical protein